VSGQLTNPVASFPGLEPPGTHWIESWVGPGTGLNAVAKKKKNPIITPARR